MMIITQSYQKLKQTYGSEITRSLLIEAFRQCGENVSETARQMQCNRRTVMKALEKQETGNLEDLPHTPINQPKRTSSEIEEKVIKLRKNTGYGKRRLRPILLGLEGLNLKNSTIGKILQRNRDQCPARPKKRRYRQSKTPKYDFSKILPFSKFQYDTKNYLDKRALRDKLYSHVVKYKLPHYQWTIEDLKSRFRFLAWSYQPTRTNGMAFELLITSWLRMHGLATSTIHVQSDGGSEVGAVRAKSFERTKESWWNHLRITRSVIRKGHPEDNTFVERSHKTDDEEFYVPFLSKIRNEKDLLARGLWWMDYYNRLRRHSSLNDLSPYQYLRFKGLTLPESFCRFPPVILDHICIEPEIINWQKIVHDQFDYYPQPD